MCKCVRVSGLWVIEKGRVCGWLDGVLAIEIECGREDAAVL